jgi:hypothetical protein
MGYHLGLPMLRAPDLHYILSHSCSCRHVLEHSGQPYDERYLGLNPNARGVASNCVAKYHIVILDSHRICHLAAGLSSAGGAAREGPKDGRGISQGGGKDNTVRLDYLGIRNPVHVSVALYCCDLCSFVLDTLSLERKDLLNICNALINPNWKYDKVPEQCKLENTRL